MKEYRYIGDHADELDGGRPLAPGDYTGPLDENDLGPKATHLIEDGLLIEVPDGTASAAEKAAAKAAAEAAAAEAASVEEVDKSNDTPPDPPDPKGSAGSGTGDNPGGDK